MTPRYHREDFEEVDLYPGHILWLVGAAGVSLGFTLCAFFLGL